MNPFRVHHLVETGSTNDDVMRAAERGEAEGFAVHATAQTSGRGRHGRVWQSPAGNLYLSVLLKPHMPLQSWGCYSFVTSLALFDTVSKLLPDAAITLKWPNDVLANGKKISGLLLETGHGSLIVGIGLNLQHYPSDALYPATSLRAMGSADLDVAHVRDAFLSNLWHWHQKVQKEGFAPIRSTWLQYAQKGQLTVKRPTGTVEGVFETIDDEGQLRIRLKNGAVETLSTGDVFFGAPIP